MKNAVILIGALVAGCSAQPEQAASSREHEVGFQIPSRFWGEYNELLSDCGTGLNDSRLRVTSNSVRFYESDGQLQDIFHLDDGSLVIVAESRGEGQVWTSSFRLSLSEDGNELTLHFPDSAEIKAFTSLRFRCPAPVETPNS